MAKAKENQETAKQTQQGGKTEQQSAQQTNGGQSGGQQMTQSNDRQQTGLSRRSQSAPALWTSPFSFMRRFGEDMDRLFEDFGFAGMQQGITQIASVPNVEMTERDGQLIIRADLPGVKKDDVQVEIRDDRVILQGERKQEREEKREGYYRSERAYGSFYREIPLPEGVNTENASANFRDGVLEITMQAPKREANGRQLQIEDAQSGGQQQAQARAAGSSR